MVGGVWSDKRASKILVIVRLVSGHPTNADQAKILTLNLLTSKTEELIYDTKLDELPWRM